MWVNKKLFETIVADNKAQQAEIASARALNGILAEKSTAATHQKVKDDLTIDWLRHRVNALEKERAILLNKTSGIVVPVPEIVPNRPGSISQLPDFSHLPAFQDVGDEEAARLGITHDDEGQLVFTK